MPKMLRSKKTAKKIWIILCLFIIPTFCFWGFGSVLRSKKEPLFLGQVFGKPISIQEYLRNYKAVRNQYIIQLGQDQFAKLEKYLNLETQTWDRIILLAEAKRKKIIVNNKEVVDWISHFPIFLSDGRFNPQLYQEIITYAFRTSPRAFEEEMRDNLTIAKLYEQVSRRITVNDEEIKNAYIKENEQISLDYILAEASDFLGEVSIEDNELLDYYEQNSKQFEKPLSYNLEYIKVSSSDKQIINKITQLLNEGLRLPEAAGNCSLEIKETGFFSIEEPIPQIGWSTEVLSILSKLKPKEKAWPQPILIDAETVYFIGLKEKKDPYIPAFDEIKDEVAGRLRKQKANQIAQERLNACRKEIETSGFVEAAKSFNLKTGTTELFKRRGYVEGIGDSDIFFETVENLKENEASQIITTPSGFYIVKLKERVEPDEEKFKQEKENFAQNLLREKKQAYLMQYLTELKNRPNTFFNATLTEK